MLGAAQAEYDAQPFPDRGFRQLGRQDPEWIRLRKRLRPSGETMTEAVCWECGAPHRLLRICRLHRHAVSPLPGLQAKVQGGGEEKAPAERCRTGKRCSLVRNRDVSCLSMLELAGFLPAPTVRRYGWMKALFASAKSGKPRRRCRAIRTAWPGRNVAATTPWCCGLRRIAYYLNNRTKCGPETTREEAEACGHRSKPSTLSGKSAEVAFSLPVTVAAGLVRWKDGWRCLLRLPPYDGSSGPCRRLPVRRITISTS